MAFRRIVGNFVAYVGDGLAVISFVTFLLVFLGVVDVAGAWGSVAFVMMWAGIAVAFVGVRLREPRERKVRSKRVATVHSGGGSGALVGAGYVAGSYRIRKVVRRYKPQYRFTVNGVRVILRHNSVTLGDDDEWKLNVSRRRAVVRSKDGSRLAEATRIRPGASQWAVSDAVMGFEATVASTKPKNTFQGGRTRMSALKWSRTQARDLTLFRSGDATEPVASLHLSYERRGHRDEDALLGSWEIHGVLDGTMEFSDPVSLAVAVLALRLALGRWARRAPRTGTWEPYQGG